MTWRVYCERFMTFENCTQARFVVRNARVRFARLNAQNSARALHPVTRSNRKKTPSFRKQKTCSGKRTVKSRNFLFSFRSRVVAYETPRTPFARGRENAKRPPVAGDTIVSGALTTAALLRANRAFCRAKTFDRVAYDRYEFRTKRTNERTRTGKIYVIGGQLRSSLYLHYDRL